MQHQPQMVLVGIKPQGVKPPLLFLPAIGGETSYAYNIAAHLRSDQPVWGVQSPELMDEHQYYRPLKEIARRYVDDLCDLQPNGSFRFAGYSFGGALAYETARQLVDRGREVKLVALIDTGLSRDSQPTLAGCFGISLAVVSNLPNWILDNILRAQPEGFVAGINNHLKKVGRIGGRIFSSNSTSYIFDMSKFPKNYLKMMEFNVRALSEYTPECYPGRVTLFRASTRPLFHSQAEDLGWSEWVTGGVEIVSVPGTHHNIVREPSVQVLARNLQSALDSLD